MLLNQNTSYADLVRYFPHMKRQRSYVSPRQQAFKRNRMSYPYGPYRDMPRVVPRRTVVVPVVPGYTRSVGAYRRSLPGSMEKKYKDTDIEELGDLTNGEITGSLNIIPQGTTDITRIGNKITITNINVHFAVGTDNLGPTMGLQNGNLRVILYLDKQANGAYASPTDILTQSGGAGVTTINRFRNMDQVDRFVILKDKTYRTPMNTGYSASTAGTDAVTNTGVIWYKINKVCKIPIHFSSTTGAITEMKSNNIGILVISDNPYTNFRGAWSRVKYVDA